MAVYVLSDLHLSINRKTNKSMEVFGSRWKNYIERIEQNWRHLVEPTDTVIIPGDISWAMTLDEAVEDFAYLDALPGNKIISKGNHDYWWATLAKATAFFEKHEFHTIKLLHNNAYEVEDFIICGSRGWFSDENVGNIPQGTDYQKIVSREAIRVRISLEEAEKIIEVKDEEDTLLVYGTTGKEGGETINDIIIYVPADCALICFWGSIKFDKLADLIKAANESI